MLKIIFLSIIIAVTTFLIQNSSQYISFSYENTLFQIPTWIIIISILIIIFLQCWLFKLAIVNWLNLKQINKSLKYAKKAFLYLITDQPSIAEHLALKINNLPNCGWLSLLLATDAAKQQASWLNAHKYLTKAEILAEQNKVTFTSNRNELAALGIIKADLYYCQKEYQKCIWELKKLLKIFPKHHGLLMKLTSIYQDMQNWEEFIELLPLLKKSKIYSNEDYQQLEINLYKNRLKQIAIKQLTFQSIENFTDKFNALPKYIKRNNHIILIYVNCLSKFKYYDLAEQTLNNYLKEKSNVWDPELIKLYGLIKTNNLSKQIRTAESWLKTHPNDPHLLLTLGKLCIEADLIGKAKNYLEQSLMIEEQPECFAALGRLSQLMGDAKKSLICYEKGLLSATQMKE